MIDDVTSDPEFFREYRRECGTKVAESADWWELSARPLLRAARLCWTHCRDSWAAIQDPGSDAPAIEDLFLDRVAVFLAAAGVETLLKALLVARDPAIVHKPGGFFYTHDLLRLAEELDPRLTEPQCETLVRYRQFLEWGGRYPIPKWSSERGRAKFDLLHQPPQVKAPHSMSRGSRAIRWLTHGMDKITYLNRANFADRLDLRRGHGELPRSSLGPRAQLEQR